MLKNHWFFNDFGDFEGSRSEVVLGGSWGGLLGALGGGLGAVLGASWAPIGCLLGCLGPPEGRKEGNATILQKPKENLRFGPLRAFVEELLEAS